MKQIILAIIAVFISLALVGIASFFIVSAYDSNVDHLAEYFHAREDECSACLSQTFNVTLDANDWQNMSRFMTDTCPSCKPVECI